MSAGRTRRRTGTCCTSSPRRSVRGLARSCPLTRRTLPRRVGSSRTAARRCWSNLPSCRWRSRRWCSPPTRTACPRCRRGSSWRSPETCRAWSRRAPDVVRRKKEDEEFLKGWELIRRHPLFGALGGGVVRHDDGICPSDGWAVVDSDGELHAHPTRHGTEREWAWVFAHCLLHLGLGHLDTATDDPGSVARDVVVNRFLAGIKFGTAPVPLPLDPP